MIVHQFVIFGTVVKSNNILMMLSIITILMEIYGSTVMMLILLMNIILSILTPVMLIMTELFPHVKFIGVLWMLKSNIEKKTVLPIQNQFVLTHTLIPVNVLVLKIVMNSLNILELNSITIIPMVIIILPPLILWTKLIELKSWLYVIQT
jgi:hypothetical protein